MKHVWAIICVALTFGNSALAQGLESGGLSEAQTHRVVAAIESVFETCARIDPVYRPDCAGRALQRGAGKISNNPGYWEAEVALTRAVRSLAKIVRDHEDEDARSLREDGYRFKPVRADRLREVTIQGAEVFRRLEADFASGTASETLYFAPIVRLLEEKRPWP
ncbi:hypothetical protein E4Z66_06865 [Aliishimia ponticola]|uniref:Uncharacterized protein n=1 Tax=Aliishimia ponticola TaxID=2499833 RepID=A0A4S4NB98_9RHOB|nr:hypothetical protein [Aliishimia ponticola]THH36666.1 hypothetical protein E4Z66_06865 [Aliishimia ponticola]